MVAPLFFSTKLSFVGENESAVAEATTETTKIEEPEITPEPEMDSQTPENAPESDEQSPEA